ncbi:AAA family ATPase [Paenibacillus agaridevorans]|uniref:AAA family ATPase n=1 Tax=Paenibacillus agaridevorans TaxID=171404 RepID=UPI001BE41FEF|nr:AAA family ATPase [Paenibacillus agaridevorans]
MLTIFLYGPMGSGKDTVAEYLEREHKFYSIALADGIRNYIGHNNPDYVPKSDRALGIEVGEKHRDWFGRDFWCHYADDLIFKETVHFHAPSYNGVIIRDGHFPHEYDHYVNRLGYVPVQIISHEINRKKRLMERDGQLNVTHFYDKNDMAITDDPEWILRNNGDLESLYEQCDRMLKAYWGGEL